MTPRKVVLSGDVQRDLTAIALANNYGEVVLSAAGLGTSAVTLVAGAGVTRFGALAIDRSVFREILGADARWLFYAAGVASSGDANPMTVSLTYRDDAGLNITLGTINVTTGGKYAMGPFDLFATATVPAGEQIVFVRLEAGKVLGANGSLSSWTIWARLLPGNR